MATYRVKPLPESEQTSNEKWQLQKSGRRVDTSWTKSDVLQRAENMATSGDVLKIENMSGGVTTKQIERTSGGRLL